ncbi:unnamed protein product [Rotaria sp. Silwood1]|nr:unnamed protein product [Rotaria sp. Silwood1]CAF3381796.1 unnamed protein product [Rotaria sp. Silwood1]CAF3392371.1 unnamed protein product [Rotaria sp. Silwood1]CAF3393675.1 unnamed protein product [Rotaria sp. Silwood1]CAF4523485.1 unnamed protein product [Rotaria sp. Silwood1]
MQNNPVAFQDAVTRAQQVAQRLAASAPNASKNSSLKRSNTEEDSSTKRPAITSPTETYPMSAPVLRAQQIAQQINSQLGVKTSNDSNSLPLANQLTFQEDYKIPDKFVGLIIGKGGEQIIRLQAESGCKVQICQLRPEPLPGGPNPPDRLANLCGTRDAVERAKRIMDDIIARGKMADGSSTNINPYSMGGTNTKTIDVMLPSAKCGLVIGKGGENIKRVSEEFGVKMYVVQDSADVDGIEHKPLRIIGESDRVERAKQYVLDSLSKSGGLPNPANRLNTNQNSTTSLNDANSRMGNTPMTGPCNEAIYHVPYDKAGLIIGKGGESIKEINRRSGAFVELDKSHVSTAGNSTDRVFKLRGTPEQIVTAQQLMYEKVLNGPGGSGDMLTPIQFQQQFNLPLVGTNSIDTWNTSNDQYGNSTNSNDPYSQWANVYGQWPQLNSYNQSASNNNDNSSTSKTAGSDMGQMDPTWLAYYQQMNYYSMMQSSMTGNTSASTTTTKSTDSTLNTSSTNNSTATTINPVTGQPDYSQQWIEYYRSIGQNEMADEIARQMKASSSNTASTTTTNTPSTNSVTNAAQATATATMMSSGNAWAAYAQQWAEAAAAANTTNGVNSSTKSSS